MVMAHAPLAMVLSSSLTETRRPASVAPARPHVAPIVRLGYRFVAQPIH
jgi:hypothetical protein